MTERISDAERAEVVRLGVAAWNDGDIDSMLEHLEPDFEMRLAGAFLGLERKYHGHGGYREFWNEFRGMWKKIEVSVDRIEHFGAAVLVDSRFEGTGREGLEVDMAFFATFHLPADKIVTWSNFTEREQAVEAARSLAGLKTQAGG